MKDQMKHDIEIGLYYQVIKRKYNKKQLIVVGRICELREDSVVFDNVVHQYIELINENAEITKTFLTNKKETFKKAKFYWLHKNSFDEKFYNLVV